MTKNHFKFRKCVGLLWWCTQKIVFPLKLKVPNSKSFESMINIFQIHWALIENVVWIKWKRNKFKSFIRMINQTVTFQTGVSLNNIISLSKERQTAQNKWTLSIVSRRRSLRQKRRHLLLFGLNYRLNDFTIFCLLGLKSNSRHYHIGTHPSGSDTYR